VVVIKKTLALVLLGFAVSSYAQEGEVQAPLPSYSQGASGLFEVKAIFDDFHNQSFRSSGLQYGAELAWEYPGEFKVYAGAPFYYGQVQNKNVSEWGNPYIGAEVMAWEARGFQAWASLENHFLHPDGAIAARHNTVIPGLELRYDKMRTVGALGVNYYSRYGEQDSHVDVKDIAAAHFSLGRKLGRRFTLEGQILWYRAFGVTKDDLIIARECDWMGAGPVGIFNLGSGVALRSELIFPVRESRSQAETEVAVWDASLPKVNEVTWRTDLGVLF
jgi:hypothetical protein